jgi:mannose-6-phosphate isomerase-like protein (cupin superfamily)
MQSRLFRPLAALSCIALIAAAAEAQSPTAATTITKADIEAVLKHTGPEGAGTDRQIRVVDLGKLNIAVGILHRTATKPGAPAGAILHSQVTEVYYIVSGGGTLVTGGSVANPRPLPADGEIVKVAVGPSVSGVFEGGERRPIAAGDVVIIPAGVPHGFAEVKDHVTYLSVRPDPDHVLPAGYVHPAVKAAK